MLIIMNPGHGGQNPGAVHGGVKEKDINLLQARLKDFHHAFIVTRRVPGSQP